MLGRRTWKPTTGGVGLWPTTGYINFYPRTSSGTCNRAVLSFDSTKKLPRSSELRVAQLALGQDLPSGIVSLVNHFGTFLSQCGALFWDVCECISRIISPSLPAFFSNGPVLFDTAAGLLFWIMSVYPEKSRITNSIFWAILDIEGFPFFLGNVCGSWAPSGPAWGLGRNLYPK